jgi:hypothetical protein
VVSEVLTGPSQAAFDAAADETGEPDIAHSGIMRTFREALHLSCPRTDQGPGGI